MRICGRCHGRGAMRASSLLELLAYLSVWLVLVGLAFTFFYRTLSQTKRLSRAADDVVRALQTGEQWREDIRAATGAPEWREEESAGGKIMSIPTAAGWFDYVFTGSNVMRRVRSSGGWREVLPRVIASEMHRDEKAGLISWRWELELKTQQAPASIKPLFTFQAVPGKGVNP